MPTFEDRICEQCERLYAPVYPTQRFCDPWCRQSYRAAELRAARKAWAQAGKPKAMIEEAKHDHAAYLPDILAVIQRADEALELLWRAGTATARERLVESLRSWWPRYMELRAETKRVADQIIAQRTAQQ